MTDTRAYPARPIVGVGAVIVEAGRVVLVRRRYEPMAGRWTLPGGMLELGETLEQGVAREMLEETGLHVRVGPTIDVFDRITRDHEDHVKFHFVLVDFVCWPVGGTLRAGSDADDAVMADVDQLHRFDLTEKATSLILKGLSLSSA